MVLVAPRNGDYITIDELVNAVQAHALKEGYAIVKGRSKSIKGSSGFNKRSTSFAIVEDCRGLAATI